MTIPFDSRHLKVCIVSNLSDELKMWSLNEILGKCLLLPHNGKWVSVPMFHTE